MWSPVLPVLVSCLLCSIPLAAAHELRATRDCAFPGTRLPAGQAGSPESSLAHLRLLEAEGFLDVFLPASTPTYTAYFHVPIAYDDQAPVYVEIESPHLIDYRFVELSPPNVIVAARLRRAPATVIHWKAWVLSRGERWHAMPWSAPIPEPGNLPDNVMQWLEPSDCVQSDHPLIRQEAAVVREGCDDLQDLADSVAAYCREIPGGFAHSPIAFDAFYTLNWGSSCTGHAHAAAALFRANGVPSRTLHVMPTWFPLLYDMHWIVEYWVPGFGWTRLESTLGQNLVEPYTEIVTFVGHLEDEFPLFFPSAISGHWHTSDPALGMYNPDWGSAHRSSELRRWIESEAEVDRAIALAALASRYRTRTWGLSLAPRDQPLRDEADAAHQEALETIRSGSLPAYLDAIRETVELYERIRAGGIRTRFFDDFEGPDAGWTHGGEADEWERGAPGAGPRQAYSGLNCWGTDLDDTYENGADNWLLSPPVDLEGLAAAYLSVRVFNEVQDRNQGYVFDPLWLEIRVDEGPFVPLCSEMGGVNDDPAIPGDGGWSRLVLDLTPWVDRKSVQFRFRFRSDGAIVQSGSYIDDVHVFGRSRTHPRARVEAPRETAPAEAPD